MKAYKFYCAVCGSEILVNVKNAATYCIKNGNLSLEYANRDHEEIFFYCSQDTNHCIYPDTDSKAFKVFEKWIEDVEELIYQKLERMNK